MSYQVFSCPFCRQDLDRHPAMDAFLCRGREPHIVYYEELAREKLVWLREGQANWYSVVMDPFLLYSDGRVFGNEDVRWMPYELL